MEKTILPIYIFTDTKVILFSWFISRNTRSSSLVLLYVPIFILTVFTKSGYMEMIYILNLLIVEDIQLPTNNVKESSDRLPIQYCQCIYPSGLVCDSLRHRTPRLETWVPSPNLRGFWKDNLEFNNTKEKYIVNIAGMAGINSNWIIHWWFIGF